MDWLFHLPLAFWTVWVFALGLCAGSFLNVVVGRLPLERSVMWPNSRCLSCLRPLPFADNLPIYGYLRRRGRCRFCGSRFSSKYMWLELFTGLAFVALFWLEIVPWSSGGRQFVAPWHSTEGLRHFDTTPPVYVWVYWAVHALLLWLLMAAAIIDIGYKIIPQQITYPGTVVGLIASTLMPWPWPTDVSKIRIVDGALSWGDPRYMIVPQPTGLALWPVWEPPAWAPAGSWQLGLLTGLAGAAAGMAVIRLLKWAFEWGFGQEALGLGDADLLMMAGAFLGWQPVVLAVPVGALLTLLVLPLVYIWAKIRSQEFDPSVLPFGPGLAAGVVANWFGWPVMSELGRPFLFDAVIIAFVSIGGYGCLLVAGLVLRRGEPAA